ncbi:potassium-transporting ATPase subunit F [Acidihalobacter aeolianus]|nr:potassium-transporting ATPase subunit F [Acidihalobacter aeolianus]
MNGQIWAAGILCIGLFAYLLAMLLYPEKLT